MREIVVISGKGGTGKTSLTAAFAHLAQSKVICDLDVDAPDLHILLDPAPVRREDFISGNLAVIDPKACSGCGLCAAKCRFGAIAAHGRAFRVDPSRCEGCKLCLALCPDEAVAFESKTCGEWMVSDTRFGTLVHARLFPGEENSGRLVTLLRRRAREIARERGLELILSDGSPGIGCPVISSLTGAGLAVIVTEPTPSGLHDLSRAAGLCAHFKVPAAVIVNKFDLNTNATKRIETFCRKRGLVPAGRIPFDPAMTLAMLERKAVTEFAVSALASTAAGIWETILGLAPVGTARVS